MRIAMLGGYGNIGREAASLLLREGCSLRIGGRRPEEGKKLFGEINGPEFFRTDGSDESFLRFAGEAGLFFNASSMGKEEEKHLISLLPETLPYVSASELKGEKHVYGAGSLPGLSGILPRAYVQEGGTEHLRFVYAVQDRFSHAAAESYLRDRSEGGRSMQVLEDGENRVFCGESSLLLPFTDGESRCFPYRNEETEELIRLLRPVNAGWFMAIRGKRTLRLLEEAGANASDDQIRRLVSASEADTAEHGRYAMMLMEYEREGRMRSVILHASSASRLTGLAAAASCISLLGKNRGYTGPFYGIRDAEDVLAAVKKLAGTSLLEMDTGLDEVGGETDGEI